MKPQYKTTFIFKGFNKKGENKLTNVLNRMNLELGQFVLTDYSEGLYQLVWRERE